MEKASLPLMKIPQLSTGSLMGQTSYFIEMLSLQGYQEGKHPKSERNLKKTVNFHDFLTKILA